jgi:hypothetical protein
MRKIRITAGNVQAVANLHQTKTAEEIWRILPIQGIVNTWGDEIYFSIPLKLEEENSKEIVEIGDLGYWPPGSAFCIFFGKTPVSKGDEIRPASPVNVFGKIIGDPTVFKNIKSGTKILVEKEE